MYVILDTEYFDESMVDNEVIGYFEVIQLVVSTPYKDILERTARVKPKGQIYIVERLSKELSDNNA